MKFKELIVDVPYPLLKGFVNGFLSGSAAAKNAYFNREHNIKGEDFTDRVKELLGAHHPKTHVIVPASVALPLQNALMRSDLGVKAIKSKMASKAAFDFSFLTYARPYGKKIQAMLKNLPNGVKTKNLAINRREDPTAKAVELYAPAHDYEMRGKGKFVGEIPAVVALHKKLSNQDLIKITPIHLLP